MPVARPPPFVTGGRFAQSRSISFEKSPATSRRRGSLVLIEAGEAHETFNEGNELLSTLNVYAPPAY